MTDYVKKLGLSYDPFVATAQTRSFYPGAGRESLLQRLVEQAHYGAPISLVCGNPGSGKTTLAREFRNSFADEAVCVQVQASLFMNQAQFLEALLVQVPVGASSPEAGDIVHDLCQFAERLYLNAKTLVVIIDDAHELAAAVLQIIDSLICGATEGAVHVLVLGENQLVEMLADALGEKALGRVIEEHLEPLSSTDAEAYMQLKLSDAGHTGENPLDTAELARLNSEAKGIPGALNIRITRALKKSGTEKTPDGFQPRDPRSILEIGAPYWATAASLVVLLMLVLIFTGPADDQVQLANTETQGNATTRIEVPLTVNGSEVAGTVATNNIPNTDTASVELIQESEPAPVIDVVPQSSSGVAETVTAISQPQELVEGVSLPESTVSAPVEAENPPDQIEQHPLMQYPPENFTVQIMGSRSEENVQRFISQQLAAFNAVYFETLHQDRPWFVVVMGNFVSRDVASRAISDLPASIRRMDPFIRQISEVQANLR